MEQIPTVKEHDLKKGLEHIVHLFTDGQKENMFDAFRDLAKSKDNLNTKYLPKMKAQFLDTIRQSLRNSKSSPGDDNLRTIFVKLYQILYILGDIYRWKIEIDPEKLKSDAEYKKKYDSIVAASKALFQKIYNMLVKSNNMIRSTENIYIDCATIIGQIAGNPDTLFMILEKLLRYILHMESPQQKIITDYMEMLVKGYELTQLPPESLSPLYSPVILENLSRAINTIRSDYFIRRDDETNEERELWAQCQDFLQKWFNIYVIVDNDITLLMTHEDKGWFIQCNIHAILVLNEMWSNYMGEEDKSLIHHLAQHSNIIVLDWDIMDKLFDFIDVKSTLPNVPARIKKLKRKIRQRSEHSHSSPTQQTRSIQEWLEFLEESPRQASQIPQSRERAQAHRSQRPRQQTQVQTQQTTPPPLSAEMNRIAQQAHVLRPSSFVPQDQDFLPVTRFIHRDTTSQQSLQRLKSERKMWNWRQLVHELNTEHFEPWKTMIREALEHDLVILIDAQNMARYFLITLNQPLTFANIRRYFTRHDIDWRGQVRDYLSVPADVRPDSIFWIVVNQKDHEGTFMSIHQQDARTWSIDVACLQPDRTTDCYKSIHFPSNPIDDLMLLNLENIFERFRLKKMKFMDADLETMMERLYAIQEQIETLIKREERQVWNGNYTTETMTILWRLKRNIAHKMKKNLRLRGISSDLYRPEILKATRDKFNDYAKRPTPEVQQQLHQWVQR